MHVPGGGLLRDGQKLLAPYALLLALCAGAAVDRTGARELRPGRVAVAGCFAVLLVSLGAAAFAAGGGSQPGPRVTPAVDVYMVQHEIMTGVLPVSRPRPAPSAEKSAMPREP